VVDLHGRSGRAANVHVGVGIDGAAFAEHLVARLTELSQRAAAQTDPALGT
jgi:hypothetical protein